MWAFDPTTNDFLVRFDNEYSALANDKKGQKKVCKLNRCTRCAQSPAYICFPDIFHDRERTEETRLLHEIGDSEVYVGLQKRGSTRKNGVVASKFKE
jgi:hypothetical protein